MGISDKINFLEMGVESGGFCFMKRQMSCQKQSGACLIFSYCVLAEGKET
jgi:hypothetical protein